MTEPSNAEQATWSDVTRDYVRDLQIEIERLRNDLRDWAECCQMDTVMQGPARMGWNRSALDRCLDKYEAALQPKEETQ